MGSKKCKYSVLLAVWLLLPIEFILAQHHDLLFHPSFRDEYLSSHVLPEGGLRVFFIADQNNGWTFREVQYIDFYPDSVLPSSPPMIISVPDGFINYFVRDAFVLRLNDGSSIIADNFFDCDYGYAGSIYWLSSSGSVLWWHYLYEDFQVDELVGMGFVDENVIGLDAWSHMFRLTTQGIPIFSSVSNQVPDCSIQTSFGYILGYSDSLEIRNASFELIQWYQLEGNILSIEPIDTASYRIQTSQKFYELDQAMQLTYLPFGVYPLWSSPDAYWQYEDEMKSVIQFDTFFEPVDTLPLSPGVKPLTGTYIGDQMMTICSNTNEINRGIVAFKDPGDHVHFDLPQDVGITQIEFPDTVLAEYFNSTVPWEGWSYTYEWVDAQVTNFGESPVSRVYIQGHSLLDCFWWCYAPVPFWRIDSLLLLPGESAWVRLPGFTTRCDWMSFDPSLCLSTVAPNDRADGQYLNDTWCESFDFILQDESPISNVAVSIYPNPASESITVVTDDAIPRQFRISLFNTSGVEVKTIPEATPFTAIPVDDLAAGMYVIKISGNREWNTITKLAIIR